ncbi:MAG TPA: hypothetical protein VGZ33_05220 [Acidimicrobiales bacterium]|nr:hypothetical protein [Acidimicrobiales bacterium]
MRRLHAPSPARLVDLLCTPTDEPPAAGVQRLVELVVARLGSAPRTSSGTTTIDAFVAEHGPARFAAPFRWSARTARRPLGPGALRRLAAGTSVGVLDAAHEEVDASCDRAQRGLARRGALGTWLAAAPREVRAVCAAEAATWATGLCHLVDWDASADRVAIGVPDAWYGVPGAPVTLHGRRDAASVHRATVAPGLLRLRDGAPGERAVEGLLVDGLVAAMSRPSSAGAAGSMPSRVIGAWPDAGCVLLVDLDAEHLRRAARTIVQCAAAAPSHVQSASAHLDSAVAA